jgi:hypothetical protein
VDIAEWAEDNESWLKQYLTLAHGTPSHDTFGRVFRLLDARVFEHCFRSWIAGLVGVVEGVIALDGKTVRVMAKIRPSTWSAPLPRPVALPYASVVLHSVWSLICGWHE